MLAWLLFLAVNLVSLYFSKHMRLFLVLFQYLSSLAALLNISTICIQLKPSYLTRIKGLGAAGDICHLNLAHYSLS